MKIKCFVVSRYSFVFQPASRRGVDARLCSRGGVFQHNLVGLQGGTECIWGDHGRQNLELRRWRGRGAAHVRLLKVLLWRRAIKSTGRHYTYAQPWALPFETWVHVCLGIGYSYELKRILHHMERQEQHVARAQRLESIVNTWGRQWHHKLSYKVRVRVIWGASYSIVVHIHPRFHASSVDALTHLVARQRKRCR